MISQKDMLGIIATEAIEGEEAKTSKDAERLSGASFHRGSSKQDYHTPENFRMAVTKKFGHPVFDLAASFGNQFSLGGRFYSEDENSLIQPWSTLGGLLWLNCPFSNIEPWASKCREEGAKGAHILFLVPASVGSNWWSMHVHNHARVYFLNPRLSFDGVAPFPKDVALCEFMPEVYAPVYQCWRWR